MGMAVEDKKKRLNKILSMLRSVSTKDTAIKRDKFKAMCEFDLGISGRKFEEYMIIFENMGMITIGDDKIFLEEKELFKDGRTDNTTG